MIQLQELTKIYHGGKCAVDHVTLDIQGGDIFGFIGPNGAGKTTTIKMMTGILSATSGKIIMNGYDMGAKPVEAKKQIAFVPDNPTVYRGATGMQYLNFVGDMYEIPTSDRRHRLMPIAKQFEISSNLHQQVDSFSHGMKQKLLITAALMVEPKIFILDEPHVGLDPHAIKVLKTLMREHCDKGGTVFFSSHVLEVVENLCDRIAIIDGGKIIAQGTLQEIRGEKTGNLEDLFLELTE